MNKLNNTIRQLAWVDIQDGYKSFDDLTRPAQSRYMLAWLSYLGSDYYTVITESSNYNKIYQSLCMQIATSNTDNALALAEEINKAVIESMRPMIDDIWQDLLGEYHGLKKCAG